MSASPTTHMPPLETGDRSGSQKGARHHQESSLIRNIYDAVPLLPKYL